MKRKTTATTHRIVLNLPETVPDLDEPGRMPDLPTPKLDLVRAYHLRVVNRLSFAQIARALGVPKSTVHAALSRLKQLVPDPEVVAAYEEVEASILTSVKEKLLASLLDPEILAKASLNNRAFAFSQVANQERLVKGRSTNNLGIATKIIESADRKLFRTKETPPNNQEGLP